MSTSEIWSVLAAETRDLIVGPFAAVGEEDQLRGGRLNTFEGGGGLWREEEDDDFDCEYCNQSYWQISYNDWIVKPEWEIGLKVSVLVLITVLGLLGNLSVLLVFWRNRLLLLHPTNLFLFNMCAADFLNLLVNPFFFIFRQYIIFRFYKLGPGSCELTPYFTVLCQLVSVFTLAVISINRAIGIRRPDSNKFKFTRKGVFVSIVLIWFAAASTAVPTVVFRRYWVRQWSDVTETNCDDTGSDPQSRTVYWTTVIVLLVWVPTLVMGVCYASIFWKIKESTRGRPYLTGRSRVQRSREKVSRVLLILFIVQVVSWFPWQFFTLFDTFATTQEYDPDSFYQQNLQLILYCAKYYFVYAGCALNPILYGYGNNTMRKAFRLTFPCFFREKPDYVLQRGGKGNTAFSFSRRRTSEAPRQQQQQQQGAPTAAVTAALATASSAANRSSVVSSRSEAASELGLPTSTRIQGSFDFTIDNSSSSLGSGAAAQVDSSSVEEGEEVEGEVSAGRNKRVSFQAESLAHQGILQQVVNSNLADENRNIGVNIRIDVRIGGGGDDDGDEVDAASRSDGKEACRMQHSESGMEPRPPPPEYSQAVLVVDTTPTLEQRRIRRSTD